MSQQILTQFEPDKKNLLFYSEKSAWVRGAFSQTLHFMRGNSNFLISWLTNFSFPWKSKKSEFFCTQQWLKWSLLQVKYLVKL